MDTMSGRVLVVDDDRAIRESLALALELDGYEVELASDGAVALAAIRERRPDVAVLDVKARADIIRQNVIAANEPEDENPAQ